MEAIKNKEAMAAVEDAYIKTHVLSKLTHKKYDGDNDLDDEID